MKILLSNGKEYSVAGNSVNKSYTYVNNVYTDCLVINVIGTLDEVKDDFNNQENLSLISLINDEGKLSAEYNGYQKLVNISIPADTTEFGEVEGDIFKVTLALTDDVKELIKTWSKTVGDMSATIVENTDATETAVKTVEELKEKVDEMTDTKDISEMSLEEAKAYKIKQSKLALEAFLENATITSSCHKSEEARYSVTSEKQQYLISMITISELAIAAGVEYQPSWNATGEPCTYDWTVDELKQLAFEMESFVRPLVSKQQAIETEIKACTTVEEVINVVISY